MPEHQQTRPPWPAWYGLAGLLAAFFTAVLASLLLAGIVGRTDAPGVNLAATVVQDAALAGFAVYFAAQTARPEPGHFGLRAFRWRTALKWTAIGILVYLVFQILYVAAFHPHEKQTTLKDLGAGNGSALTILIGVLVVGIAPPIEEFFFRGFLFGAFRTSLSFVPAALLGGLIFGIVHAGTGIQAVPPLAALGFSLCLIYEATGSILPGICVHAINNMVAFGVDKQGSWTVGTAVAVSVVTLCVTVPRRSRTLT